MQVDYNDSYLVSKAVVLPGLAEQALTRPALELCHSVQQPGCS